MLAINSIQDQNLTLNKSPDCEQDSHNRGQDSFIYGRGANDYISEMQLRQPSFIEARDDAEELGAQRWEINSPAEPARTSFFSLHQKSASVRASRSSSLVTSEGFSSSSVTNGSSSMLTDDHLSSYKYAREENDPSSNNHQQILEVIKHEDGHRMSNLFGVENYSNHLETNKILLNSLQGFPSLSESVGPRTSPSRNYSLSQTAPSVKQGLAIFSTKPN